MDFTIISSCASTKYVRSLASVSVHRNDRGYCTGCRMQRGGLREPIGGGAKECLVTGVWAPNVGEPLDINWQPEGRGHGQFGRLPKSAGPRRWLRCAGYPCGS